MKRLLLVSALAVSTMLGSCSTVPTNTQISAIITQVEQFCNGLCNFVPDANVIEQILNANNPVLTSINAIGTAICAVIRNIPAPAMSSMLRGTVAPPTLVGVELHGVFTKGPNAGHRL